MTEDEKRMVYALSIRDQLKETLREYKEEIEGIAKQDDDALSKMMAAFILGEFILKTET